MHAYMPPTHPPTPTFGAGEERVLRRAVEEMPSRRAHCKLPYKPHVLKSEDDLLVRQPVPAYLEENRLDITIYG